MSNFAITMPEPKYRSTRNRGQQIHLISASEYKYEARNFKLAPVTTTSMGTRLGPQLVTAKSAAAAEKTAFKLTYLWPVAVGLFLTGFSSEWLAMANQAGIWVTRFAFPLALLSAAGDGINTGLALYAQLPLDGLFLGFTLLRGRSLKSAVMQVLAIHALCASVLWLIGTTVA